MEAGPLPRNFFIPRSCFSRLGGVDVRELLQFQLDASLEALGGKFLPGEAAKLARRASTAVPLCHRVAPSSISRKSRNRIHCALVASIRNAVPRDRPSAAIAA
jgi:hypothetical protein